MIESTTPIPVTITTTTTTTTSSTPSKESETNKPILALEPPPIRKNDDSNPIQLNVTTSEPVSLYNQLGPTIVASDGVSEHSI